MRSLYPSAFAKAAGSNGWGVVLFFLIGFTSIRFFEQCCYWVLPGGSGVVGCRINKQRPIVRGITKTPPSCGHPDLRRALYRNRLKMSIRGPPPRGFRGWFAAGLEIFQQCISINQFAGSNLNVSKIPVLDCANDHPPSDITVGVGRPQVFHSLIDGLDFHFDFLISG